MAGFPVANTVLNGGGFPVPISGGGGGGFTLQASGTFGSGSSADPFSITLPSSYVTVLNDCIVIAVGCSGAGALVGSGCGATWVTLTSASTAPEAVFLVGYGCTAGGTSVSISGGGAALIVNAVISVWAGVLSSASPVRGSQSGAATGAGSVSSSPALSYNSGDLVIGQAVAGNGVVAWTGGTQSWSDGATNTNIAIADGTGKSMRCDYEKPSSTSSTTYTAALVSGTQTLRANVVALKHS